MVNNILVDCGSRLKSCREENKLTLEEVGKKIGVHKSTISRWEKGEVDKIKLPILQMLADLYGVNVIWLMGHNVPKKKSENEIYIDYYSNNIDTFKKILSNYIKNNDEKETLELLNIIFSSKLEFEQYELLKKQVEYFNTINKKNKNK